MDIPDLTAFTSNWTAPQRRRAAVLCSIITLPVTIASGFLLGNIFQLADTNLYLDLANGLPTQLPFASRQLGPLIVRGLVHTGIFSVHSGYYLEGVLALLVFFAITLWFLLRSGTPRFMFAAVFSLFFWSNQFNSLVLPDLLYGALLGVFLLFLYRRQYLLAALMLFPLMVSRESTFLTLLCFLIAGWRRLRLPEALLAIAATVAGTLLVKHLTAGSFPNGEHISPGFYMLAKMPWGFLKNVLGLNPWSNVYVSCANPIWQMPVHLGPVHAIGICGFEPLLPLGVLYYLLASFGLFPLLVVALRKPAIRAWTQSPISDGILLRFCLLYGAVSFMMAPLLGESFQRLFAYGWPLFLIALPILLTRAHATLFSNRAALAFLAIHVAISWSAAHFHQFSWIPVEIALWIAGYVLLSRTLTHLQNAP